MNCCNAFGQCTQGADCAARATHTKLTRAAYTAKPNSAPAWQFCHMQDVAPHTELASDAFYLIGFVFFVAVICAAAGLAWGLLSHFYPSTACMVQMLFSTACK